MQREEPVSETRKELAEELPRGIHYTNDLIKPAARVGLTVDVMMLRMYRPKG